MKNVLNKYMALLIIISFNGCNSSNNDNNSTFFTKGNTSSQSNNIENKKLSKIGIYKENDKIIIDINKTKSFLNKLTKTLKKEAKNIHEKNKDLNITDLGISANKDKVSIDLNKTKNFLDNFAKEIEGVAKEIDKTISE